MTDVEIDAVLLERISNGKAWDALNNFYMRFPYIGGEEKPLTFRIRVVSNLERPGWAESTPLWDRIKQIVDLPENEDLKGVLLAIEDVSPNEEQYAKFWPVYTQLRSEGFTYSELVS